MILFVLFYSPIARSQLRNHIIDIGIINPIKGLTLETSAFEIRQVSQLNSADPENSEREGPKKLPQSASHPSPPPPTQTE